MCTSIYACQREIDACANGNRINKSKASLTLTVGSVLTRGSFMIIWNVLKRDNWNIMAGILQSKAIRWSILITQWFVNVVLVE